MPLTSTNGIHGEKPAMGFIATELNFFRPPGDGGQARTWSFPIIKEVAKDSFLQRLVKAEDFDPEFMENLVAAATRLADQGCVGIITSCGFLAMAQPELARRLPIPIATSSLIQIPSIMTFLPPKTTVGIITFDGARLNAAHLEKLGIANASSFPIIGCPDGGYLRGVIRDGTPYDHASLEAELVECAKTLVKENEDKELRVGAIVLECTQLPPFAAGIQAALGLPVFDVYTLGEWFYSGLVRRPFGGWTEEDKIEAKEKKPRSEKELVES